MQEQRTIAFYTLGCKLNYSETSHLGRIAEQGGYVITSFENGADVYVINTCSVTDHADKKCRHVVRQALRKNKNAYIVVVGCYAQLKPKEIAAIPGVDIVLGAAEKFRLADYLADIGKNQIGKTFTSPIAETKDFVPAYSLGERTRTFLKVQDGCDYNCSFCTIPLARGSSRSNTITHVLKMVEDLAAKGVKEVVLTGVNLGDFGQNGETFFDLIRALDAVDGIERFRISSIEPNLLTEQIIRFVSTSKKIVPHFHVPLQSGNNKILRLMRRRYLRELYAERVSAIKQYMPHCSIGADVITGFPGETHDDFLETYHFLNSLNISYMHVFTYSERPGTHALSLDGIVPQKIRNERTAQLISLSEKKKKQFYFEQLGTVRNVLWEAEQEGNMMTGFTDNYVKVKTAYDPLFVNTVTAVLLKEFSANGHEILSDIEELSNAVFVNQQILHHNY